ncbi:hypothetical protein GCK72_022566 [Caenorhabditis remanei]|uniref:Uncharacterized protein n=1 Tax=Caenorhabditis remanei TaxID=31234 RepID=A0A6A5FUA1_CAERE|nr:hypothetical protein GCK72_022566 [Caenorhabditis remanei]KAF1746114.1 hypothetical protein GCK72_022566 [Caenorhabditis remanei]
MQHSQNAKTSCCAHYIGAIVAIKVEIDNQLITAKKEWNVLWKSETMKGSMIECPTHFEQTEPKAPRKMKKFACDITHCHYCGELDEEDELNKCKKCSSVYHQNSVFVKRIDKEMADKNQCDICRENGVIRLNSPVLAKVNFHFWLGITRKWDDYPNKKESIVPLNKVVHLTTKYFKMPRKEEEKKLWEDAVAKFKSRGEFPKEMQQPNSSKRQMLWKNEGWSSAEEKMMLTKGKKIKCSAFRGDM